VKKSIALVTLGVSAALCCAVVWAAEKNQRPETPVLPAPAYRVPLEEIIVEGKLPYWQREAPPRWDAPKVEAPKPGAAETGRLQWVPPYQHDERDDYNSVREQLSNPPPRMKIFEIRF